MHNKRCTGFDARLPKTLKIHRQMQYVYGTKKNPVPYYNTLAALNRMYSRVNNVRRLADSQASFCCSSHKSGYIVDQRNHPHNLNNT